MLHSVNMHDRAWLYPKLSVPLSMIAALLAFLRKNRYRTLFLEEWLERRGSPGTGREIVLTFDDGYLDNWVYLYPLLEKYECKATIFVNPEFVQPGVKPRRHLGDVWNKALDPEHLDDLGYLNWPEILSMDRSPWMDIQSHSMTHTWYPSSGRVVDFHLPRCRTHSEQPLYPWLAWNTFIEEKPFSLNLDLTACIPFGTPVFEHERSLGMRRFLPSEEHLRRMASFAAEQKPGFFFHSDCRERLFAHWTDLSSTVSDRGSFESDDERLQRYRFELLESKAILERELQKTVSFLCWPGGAYNDESVALAWEAGYVASTLASKDRTAENRSAKGHVRIPRQGIGSRVFHDGKDLGTFRNPKLLVHRIHSNAWLALAVKVEKAFHILMDRMRHSADL